MPISFSIPIYSNILAYAQSQMPVALILSDSDVIDPSIEEILNEEGYSIQMANSMPVDPDEYDLYNVIIADDFTDILNGLPYLDNYIRFGGGFVYTSSVASFADLENNCCLFGAEVLGYTTDIQDAIIVVDNPLNTDLEENDLLIQQAGEGAIWVANLTQGAQKLAEYGNNQVFSYTYEFNNGRVFFQAETSATDAANQLLRAGILWSTGYYKGCWQECPIDENDDDLEQFLPEGTVMTAEDTVPAESYLTIFSEAGSASHDFPPPSTGIEAIFIAVGPALTGAALFFEIQGNETLETFIYNAAPGSSKLLTFPSAQNITQSSLVVGNVLDTTNGNAATLGYVVSEVPTPENKEDPIPAGDANEKPIIGALGNYTTYEGRMVFLTAFASDSDGFIEKYTWVQTSGPPVTLFGADSATASFVAPAVNSTAILSFSLTVADNLNDMATTEIYVIITDITTSVIVDAGPDAFIAEGSIIRLNGTINTANNSGSSAGGINGNNFAYRWVQVSGDPVNLSDSRSLNPTIVAPLVDNGTTKILSFRLDLLDNNTLTAITSDEVTIHVNNALSPFASGYSLGNVSEVAAVITPITPVPETFGVSMVFDIQPPEQIQTLKFEGFSPYRVDVSPSSQSIVGLWLNTSSIYGEGLELHFGYRESFFYMELPENKTVAYVFDRPVSLVDVWIGAESISGGVREMRLAYYYDEVPLAPQALLIPSPPILQDSISQQEIDPSNPAGIWINLTFDGNNPLFVTLLAAAPGGAAIIIIKLAFRHRRMKAGSIFAQDGNSSDEIVASPATVLFPSFDPIAGEAEKARPILEELERMLGTNLDTASNASDLLDKFASGSKSKNQRQA